jgi:hypothetical protein
MSQKKLYSIQEEIKESCIKAYGVTASRYDGMPHGKGDLSQVERGALRIVELEKSVINLEIAIIRYKRIIYNHIYSFPDSQLRLILILRYIDNLSWRSIEKALNDGNSAETYKKYVYRSLKEYENRGISINEK